MSTAEKSWSSEAGPRQTKQVMDAIGDLKYHGRQINRLTDHGVSCVVPYPGQVSTACLQAIETIGNAVQWKITKENYKNIIAACAHAVKIVPIPEVDERSTPEEREAREKAHAAQQAAYEEKSKADKQAIKAGLLVQATPRENLIDQYNRLQAEHPDDLILLRVGDFYEAFGDNAEILHKELMLTLTSRDTVPMAGFPHHALESHSDILQKLGYTLFINTYQPVSTGTSCHVEKHHHTKHGFDFWLVVSDTRVDEDTYKAIRKRCEALGGWYSRKWGKCPGGYAFKDETVANQFAASL